jgi:UDP-2,3-diacylglucosamine pyrophosphatase LpxH
MNIIKLQNDVKLAVVGDIHAHSEQFFKIFKQVTPTDKLIFVSVGDLFNKGFGDSHSELVIDALKPYVKLGQAFVLRGNHELKLIQKCRQNKEFTEHLWWCDKQPLAISFEFENQSKVTIVHGGVTPNHTWDDLNFDVETSYVRNVDDQGKMVPMVWKKDKENKKFLELEKPGKKWHEVYDGRFGYIISGHDAQRNGVPKFYNYSCNIDTCCYQTGILTCLIYGSNGQEELITATGPAARPLEEWREYLKCTK